MFDNADIQKKRLAGEVEVNMNAGVGRLVMRS